MKKFLALILALMMVFALAACGEEPTEESPAPAESEEPAPAESETPNEETPPEDETPEAVTDANSIEDNITSDDGTYEVAFVTDVGQLHDKSFNEGTWNGVKLYAYNNGLTYKYYQPANGDQATDDDRVNAMQDAVNNGAQDSGLRRLPAGGRPAHLRHEQPRGHVRVHRRLLSGRRPRPER